jgi:hypothetical protein
MATTKHNKRKTKTLFSPSCCTTGAGKNKKKVYCRIIFVQIHVTKRRNRKKYLANNDIDFVV